MVGRYWGLRMADPKVSVLMSVFNGERYLREAIDSILNQTFSNFEFVIIDDGSIDSSNEIIRSYNDPRIRLIENEINIGLTKSLNKGIDDSQGKYIARMDADDISLPERLEKQVNFMESNPEVGICGTLNRVLGVRDKGEKILNYPKDHETARCMLLFQNVFDHSTLMMSRKKLKKNQLRYDVSIKYAQDYDLISKASGMFKLANIQEVLLFSRKHSGQIRNKYGFMQKEVARFIQKRYLSDLGIKPTKKELDLHNNTITLCLPAGKETVLETAKWLRKIKLANFRRNVYDQEILGGCISELWLRVCNAYSELGYWIWTMRSHFDFYGARKKRLFFELKFLGKCLLKY